MPNIICSVCDQIKPLSEFHKRKQSSTGVDPRCKNCKQKYEEFRKFGTTYDDLIKVFGNKCGICGIIPERLHIDHDHKCCKLGCPKCIRGLLCSSCNYQIGVLENRPGWMKSALQYLGRDDF